MGSTPTHGHAPRPAPGVIHSQRGLAAAASLTSTAADRVANAHRRYVTTRPTEQHREPGPVPSGPPAGTADGRSLAHWSTRCVCVCVCGGGGSSYRLTAPFVSAESTSPVSRAGATGGARARG